MNEGNGQGQKQMKIYRTNGPNFRGEYINSMTMGTGAHDARIKFGRTEGTSEDGTVLNVTDEFEIYVTIDQLQRQVDVMTAQLAEWNEKNTKQLITPAANVPPQLRR